MEKNAYIEMFTVEDHHWWYIGLHNLVLLLIKKYFQQQKLRILDAGCGTGGLISRLSNAGYHVEGIDYSAEAISLCKKRGLERISRADINTWKPIPDSYDLIVSLDVLCHRWVEDEIQVLKSLATGLKQDGLIMLNYPAFPILSRHHDKVVMIRERYTKKSLRERISRAGLSPIQFSYRLPHAFLFLLFNKMLYGILPVQPDNKSDIADIPSQFINQLLIRLAGVENRILARGIFIPFGSSLFVTARKKQPDA